MVRFIRAAALLALAFGVAGCGAKNEASSTVPSGADFAPASSVVYVTGITDPSSDQWQKADELLSHFPGRAKLLAELQEDLAKDGLTWEGDLKPALGDDLNLALLSYKDADHNYVFFTKPKDEAKFNEVLESRIGRRRPGAPEDRRLDGLRRQREGARQLRRGARERQRAGRRRRVQGRDGGHARRRGDPRLPPRQADLPT